MPPPPRVNWFEDAGARDERIGRMLAAETGIRPDRAAYLIVVTEPGSPAADQVLSNLRDPEHLKMLLARTLYLLTADGPRVIIR